MLPYLLRGGLNLKTYKSKRRFMKKFKVQNAYLVFALLLTVFMAGCSNGGDGVVPVVGDTTAPTVTLTVPAPDATDVASNSTVSATFSKEMLETTITSTTFTVTGPGGLVASQVIAYVAADKTAIFTPAANFVAGATYTVKITTGVTDLVGNPLAVDKVWTFTAAIAPIVAVTVPAATATEVALTSKITANFSKEMTANTINDTTFTVAGPAGAVDGVVTYVAVGRSAVFTPAAELAAGIEYTATITTGVKDLAGNPLAADMVWTFTTGTAADTTAPTVLFTDPLNNATEVVTNKKVSATFSEPIDPATIIDANFTIVAGTNPLITGTLAYSGLKATFTPTNRLDVNTDYTATIAGIKDLAGNPLLNGYEWSFRTAASVAAGPAPVDLGLAGNFVLLTKTGITTTGVTHITGDIGVSPIDSTGMTGFGETMEASNVFSTSSLVTGRLYAADYAAPTPTNMTTSISDMETAYTDAAGRSLPDFTELGAGNISTMDLAPGLYKWSTGVLIDLNGVTLTGEANDVWIFQIADNLTVNNGAIITLAGNAQAKNVFWQVGGGTGVSLGTTVQMQGIILATKAITFDTGATLTGRALAQTNVTLDANTITAP